MYFRQLLLSASLSITEFKVRPVKAARAELRTVTVLADEPAIRCGENSISVKFQTRNPFEGHIFVKGHYADQGCRTDESNNNEPQISLSFNSCGVRRVRSVRIVLQHLTCFT